MACHASLLPFSLGTSRVWIFILSDCGLFFCLMITLYITSVKSLMCISSVVGVQNRHLKHSFVISTIINAVKL